MDNKNKLSIPNTEDRNSKTQRGGLIFKFIKTSPSAPWAPIAHSRTHFNSAHHTQDTYAAVTPSPPPLRTGGRVVHMYVYFHRTWFSDKLARFSSLLYGRRG
jgi:hypothetical protein